MTGPIHFDDESCGMAVEIDDKTVDDLLPAEMESVQLISAQGSPEDGLFRGHCLSHLLRTLDNAGVDALTSNNPRFVHWTTPPHVLRLHPRP
jgi:hypothetical protein